MERTYITNNHLKSAVQEFQKYMDKDEEPPQDVFIEMMNELKVSNLLIPGKIEGDSLNFENLSSEEDDITVLPLFTDDEEFIRQNGEDYELDPIACDFDYYLDLIENVAIDGILINCASDEFLIESELLLEYPFIQFVEDDGEDEGFEAEKLKDIAKSTKNDSLLEFIRSGDTQFEALMLELQKSSPLNVVASEESLDEFGENGIISADDVGDFELCTANVEDGEFAILFTDIDAISKTKCEDMYCYCQLALLDEFFEYVLCSDMDGIIINPGLEDYVIPRSYILEAYGALTYSNPDFKKAIDYAFII